MADPKGRCKTASETSRLAVLAAPLPGRGRMVGSLVLDVPARSDGWVGREYFLSFSRGPYCSQSQVAIWVPIGCVSWHSHRCHGCTSRMLFAPLDTHNLACRSHDPCAV